MVRKEPFKVHLLSKHIEDTKKGLSAEAQYNRRPGKIAAPIAKKSNGTASNIFSNDDSPAESDSSDSDSDSDSGSELMRKLSATTKKGTSATKPASKQKEIADSDVERHSAAKKPTTTTASVKKSATANVKTERPSSDDTSSSGSDSESEEDEPQVNANGTSGRKSASTSSTSESDSSSEAESDDGNDSDSESDSSNERSDAARIAKPAASTAASESSSDTSDSESGSESESDDEAEAVNTQKSVQAKKPTSRKASTPTSSSASEEGEPADESVHISDRQGSIQVARPQFASSHAGFALRRGEIGASAEDLARLCNEANMEGKQLWYFTVPSNVPISVVQNLEIPMDHSAQGGQVLSHNGEQYGLAFNNMTPKTSFQILIPSADDSHYYPAPRQLDQVMQVKRIAQIGDNTTLNHGIGPANPRTPRAQPKGLKQRNTPLGVNTNSARTVAASASNLEEDAIMGDASPLPATASTSTPKQSSKDKKTKKKEDKIKSKPLDTIETDSQSVVASRKTKRKHTISDDEAAAAAEQLMEENMTAETKTKKRKTDRHGSPELGSQLPSEASRRETPVVPPTVPGFGSSQPVSSPAAKKSASAASKSKKASKVSQEAAVPPSSQTTQGTVTQTPIPIPRQTPIPLPSLAVQPKVSAVPIPLPKAAATPGQEKGNGKVKKEKKKDSKSAATVSSHAQPPKAGSKGKD